MWSKKELIIFFAGAQAFHTLLHILMFFSNMLPIKFFSINLTKQLNFYSIIFNLIITVLLILWASRVESQTIVTKPFINNIFELTKQNNNFRNVLAFTNKSEIVLMNILPGEDIGKETHDIDQIIVFIQGTGKAIINKKEYSVEPGSIFQIPAFTEHNFINIGQDDLKLFTIYSPPEFKKFIIQKYKSQK